MKIKKGDTVVVISGKDKGKEGTVSRVMPTTNQIIVDGINVVKKHQKPSGTNQQGGIIDRDMPLHAGMFGDFLGRDNLVLVPLSVLLVIRLICGLISIGKSILTMRLRHQQHQRRDPYM